MISRMLIELSLAELVLVFLGASVFVWIAGIQLSNSVERMDKHFSLSQALGGLIFLAITTNLPEIAIVISAGLSQSVGIAIGNILGGIAIQTVVLAWLDGVGLGRVAPLTYRAASLQLILEGVLVIAVLMVAIMGSQLPDTLIFGRLVPSDVLIVIMWLGGLVLINKARVHLPWHKKGLAPDVLRSMRQRFPAEAKPKLISLVILYFILASLVTLIAGALLERSASEIALRIHWSGVLFGSTILAAVTALPEVATGLAAMRMGDYILAVSDIFGGNAFLPCLFLLATVLSGQAVLPHAQDTDIYLACLGVLLTSIYLFGLVFRSKRQCGPLGIDSLMVISFYCLGLLGLFYI